jgi:hypothetical protein
MNPPFTDASTQDAYRAFVIALTIISIAFNLDWKHYVRYWMGRTPNYKGGTVIVIRLIFLAVAINGIRGCIRLALPGNWSPSDIKYTIGIAAMMVLAGLLVDIPFRLAMGRPIPTPPQG